MGCDIHAYIESYSSEDYNNDPKRCFVNCFAENVHFGRDYKLFGLIANVRSMNNKSNMDPKGVPTSPEMSYVCSHHYYLSVCDDSAAAGTAYAWLRSDRSVTRQAADKMVSDGSSKYIDSNKNTIIDPDWHSATYLHLDEMMKVRKAYLLDTILYESEIAGKKRKELVEFIESKDPVTLMQYSFPEHDSLGFYVAIKTMQAIESGSGGDVKSRLVCWFDS